MRLEETQLSVAQTLASKTNSVTMHARSCCSNREVSPVESASGSMEKFFTPVYRVTVCWAAYRSIAEPLETYWSTSAMPISTRLLPSGRVSAYSIWSRSREVSLSMEDQS